MKKTLLVGWVLMCTASVAHADIVTDLLDALQTQSNASAPTSQTQIASSSTQVTTQSESQIAALQKLVAELTATLARLIEEKALRQIATPSQTTSTPIQSSVPEALTLTRTLYFGSRGNDVRALQEHLIAQHLLSADSATGFFGNATQRAVEAFQCAQLLLCTGTTNDGYGVVGPRTRIALAQSGTQSTTNTQSPQSPSGPPATTPLPDSETSIPNLIPPMAGGELPSTSNTGSSNDDTTSHNIPTPHIARCHSGWICPATPILDPTTTIGAWYSTYWQPQGQPQESWSKWARYSPLLGTYDSGNPSIVAHHINSMNTAGIEYILLDMTNGIGGSDGEWEKNTQSIAGILNSLPVSNRMLFAFAVGCGLWCENPSIELANAESQFVWQNYAQMQSYLHWDGKPLLVVYNDLQNPTAFGRDWMDTRFTIRHAAGEVFGTDPELQQYREKGLWGWVTHFPQLADALTETMTVMPGWDTAHPPLNRSTTPQPRMTGDLYMKQWLNVLKLKPKNVIIASWNDWAEETMIEPGYAQWRDYHGNEVPDWYLQITTAYANLRTGLMQGVYYRDVNNPQVYVVQNGSLQPVSVLPMGKPVIYLPDDTLASIVFSQNPSPTKYTIETDFSGTHGSKQWTYLYRTGTTDNLMNWVTAPWNSAVSIWQGNESFLQIYKNAFHPGIASDANLQWTAPSAGTIQISGTISDGNTTCGNGVMASIMHNTTMLKQYTLENGGADVSHEFTRPVSAGDKVYFLVNARGDNSCDSTKWNPTIEYFKGI